MHRYEMPMSNYACWSGNRPRTRLAEKGGTALRRAAQVWAADWRDLPGLVLQDDRAGGLQRMLVLERHGDGLVERSHAPGEPAAGLARRKMLSSAQLVFTSTSLSLSVSGLAIALAGHHVAVERCDRDRAFPRSRSPPAAMPPEAPRRSQGTQWMRKRFLQNLWRRGGTYASS
jgi:hypothetical protein